MIRNPRLLVGTGLSVTLLAAAISGCSNNGETPAPGGAQVAASGGASVFQSKCQGCHGANGAGGSGPALAPFAGETEANLRRVVENGDGKMPAFKGQLTDEQITQVVAYVKSLKG